MLVTEDSDLGTAAPHQEPVLPDFDRQATTQSYCICRSDAVRADDSLLNGQEVCLTRPNEPVAVVTVLWRCGTESQRVFGAELGHRAVSLMRTITQLLLPTSLQNHKRRHTRCKRRCRLGWARCIQDTPSIPT